jgi:hypothetical protein
MPAFFQIYVPSHNALGSKQVLQPVVETLYRIRDRTGFYFIVFQNVADGIRCLILIAGEGSSHFGAQYRIGNAHKGLCVYGYQVIKPEALGVACVKFA